MKIKLSSLYDVYFVTNPDEPDGIVLVTRVCTTSDEYAVKIARQRLVRTIKCVQDTLPELVKVVKLDVTPLIP